MKNNSVAIIIPMYNEERGAKRCVEAIMATLKEINHTISLLVVNDGSKDKTKVILHDLEKKYSKNFIVVHHPKNQGYGAGLQTGIQEALKRGFIWGLFMDSDLTNDPKYIKEFIRYTSDLYDCIKASRYIPGGRMVNVPQYRQRISRIGNFIARNLFRVGIHDITNGFRMVRLKLLENITFREKQFAIILEEFYYLKKEGARFKEFPNTLTSRIDTQSSFSYTLHTFWSYLKYALKAAFVRYHVRLKT